MDNISNIVLIHVFERLMEVDTKHSADSTKHYFTFSFLFCKDFKGYGNSWDVFVLFQHNRAAQHAISKTNSMCTAHLPFEDHSLLNSGICLEDYKSFTKEGPPTLCNDYEDRLQTALSSAF